MKKENYILIEELRHELHKHPELSCEEKWTKRYLMDFLRTNTSLEIHDKGRYFYAVSRAGNKDESKKAIAFRADFDALPIEDEIDKPWKSSIPGAGHKCGHDGHSAALCGLGLELESMEIDRDVYLLFQHAEETGRGAIEAKQFLLENKDIDEIFAFHNQVGEPLGKILVSKDSANCASKGMSIFMKGEPTHASLPEKGKNPVFALTRVVDAISEFTEPSQYKGLVLCTVVQLNVGDYAFGTAACDGVLRITIRAEFEDEMNLLQQKIERFAKKEADKEELELHFKFEDEFPETRNTKDSVAKIYRATGKLNYEVGEKPMSRGSEDFGHYTKIVPGAIFYIGAGEDVPSFHTSEYDFTDSVMENAVEMFKALIEE